MRIRCSKGLRVSAFFGHFFIRSSDLLALPACDVDKVGATAGQLAGGGGISRGVQPSKDHSSASHMRVALGRR